MEHTRETKLGTERVGKLLFQLSLPAITAQIVNVLYNMVDRMYIGHIPVVGKTALTGLGVTMPAILAISAFAALVSMGGAPRASIMLGRQEPDQAEKVLGNCTNMLVMVALALTAVFQLFGEQILLLFGASENTISYAWDYMQIYTLGTIFVQMALGLNAFITCQGFAKVSMYTVLIGAVCNIVLDPIFIFACNMGVRGAALATIISQAVSCIWVIQFLRSEKSILKLRTSALKLDFKVLLPCLALGVSPFIMQFTESVLFICFNTSLLMYGGDIAVGAMTILSSVMQFSMLPLQGLTQGAQPIVSFNYGARNAQRVKKTFSLLLISSLVYSTTLWAVSIFAPTVLIGIFTPDPQLTQFSVWAIRIYMAAALLLGAQIACQQTFISLGNAKASLFLALLRKVILLIPLIYILPTFIDPLTGVFLAEPIADLIAVTVTLVLFITTFRKLLKKLEAGSSAL